MEFRRPSTREERHRHESVWDARSEWLGARGGALAGRSGGGEYGKRGNHAHRRGWSVPAATAGVSLHADAAISAAAGTSAERRAGWRGAGGTGGDGPLADAKPLRAGASGCRR